MSSLYSNHAQTRMQRRGMSNTDVELVISTGTALYDNSVILLKRDAEREITKRKNEIKMLERLRSVRVVLGSNGTIVTAYKTNRKIEKCLLNGTHKHSH